MIEPDRLHRKVVQPYRYSKSDGDERAVDVVHDEIRALLRDVRIACVWR
jgi:hypothetical protein